MEDKKTFSGMIKGNIPVLVDFSAEWCGPCKMMKPILKELSGRIGNQAIVLNIDVDKNPSVSQAYQIRSVPTLILFQNGRILWRQSGVVNATQLESVINQISETPVKS
ncbi:MAG: thioredoxin [Chryseosolibacter sp.]